MQQLFGVLAEIAAAKDMQTIWNLGLAPMQAAGFGRVNFGFTRFRTAAMHAAGLEDAVFFSSCPADYLEAYFTDGFFARTPLYRWTMTHDGACTWDWVEEAYTAGRLSPAEAETVRQNHRFGVRAGVTISFPSAGLRDKGAMALIADPGLGHEDVARIWAERGPALLAVAHMMHLKICQLPQISRKRPLTTRQREVLEWVADGKTMQDIAVVMGVSVAAVEKHLRLARAALDVETTAQAVAKGLLLNLFFRGAAAEA